MHAALQRALGAATQGILATDSSGEGVCVLQTCR